MHDVPSSFRVGWGADDRKTGKVSGMTPAWYDPRKAAQVVSFFAKCAGGSIHVLKVVKLVYLADREALAHFDAPILSDKFVSMPYGPVNSLTLNHIDGTADDAPDWNEFLTDREGHFIGLRNPDITTHDLDEISPAEMKILQLVWNKFGHMDRFELAKYTHDNCPEWEDPHGSSNPIPVERIFKYLGKTDGTALAAKLESERIMDEIFARAHGLPADQESDFTDAVGTGQ
jgi:uncharacterized phage-associated protein